MVNESIVKVLLASGPASGKGESTAPFWVNMVPMFLMVFVFYYIFIRPQQRKARELDTLVKTLRSGDKVVTSSGIVGVVVSVKEKTVSLRSGETKMEVLKSSINDITERGGQAESTP